MVRLRLEPTWLYNKTKYISNIIIGDKIYQESIIGKEGVQQLKNIILNNSHELKNINVVGGVDSENSPLPNKPRTKRGGSVSSTPVEISTNQNQLGGSNHGPGQVQVGDRSRSKTRSSSINLSPGWAGHAFSGGGFGGGGSTGNGGGGINGEKTTRPNSGSLFRGFFNTVGGIGGGTGGNGTSGGGSVDGRDNSPPNDDLNRTMPNRGSSFQSFSKTGNLFYNNNSLNNSNNNMIKTSEGIGGGDNENNTDSTDFMAMTTTRDKRANSKESISNNTMSSSAMSTTNRLSGNFGNFSLFNISGFGNTFGGLTTTSTFLGGTNNLQPTNESPFINDNCSEISESTIIQKTSSPTTPPLLSSTITQLKEKENLLLTTIVITDIDTVAQMFKMYLRELPEPVITFTTYDALMILCSQREVGNIY